MRVLVVLGRLLGDFGDEVGLRDGDELSEELALFSQKRLKPQMRM